ncbi:S8 family peptidase [Cytophagaceae bacterium YF14B1]|uniref:S8 family peptidase n=1 Tax=Xanthocytophaga flava TaxID=3048013 RepID=A0AAE3U9L9_9BACT|nr:S8 family peptidase [Xanthocytophaga flavus]MDJ1484591.1 S8 family peptidase [Xanthocytophaga flavus]
MIRINIRRVAQPIILAALLSGSGFAQSADTEKKAPENWFNLDPITDKVYGVSTEKVYQELLKGRTAKPVIVAVIDGGVDVNHEDLKSVIWTNPKEIPNNGKDDDKNGYIDDVYGWDFIGGKDSSVHYDNLELTRLYRSMLPKFEKADTTKFSEADKKEYTRFKEISVAYEKEAKESQGNYFGYQMMMDGIENMKKKIGKETITAADVQAYKPTDPVSEQVKQIVENALASGATFNELVGQLKEAIDYFEAKAKYHTNLDYDPRSIVGDNYTDAKEKIYGNNDVVGPDADHGTHVAGIIAAVRDNNLGIKGVSNATKIMVLRVVPNGDERDKDVANSIRYAADNGAKVINMSFGKSYSWNKGVVDEAVKYAASKDVLLIHAAGNDAQNNDEADNFPNDEDDNAKEIVNNWVEVGASSWKSGEQGIGDFSNYGKNSVDVFAPGVAIHSTTPGSKYADHNGTSMAAPVVSGVAALIRAYYPKLKAAQVKEILMKSALPYKEKVQVPGSEGQTANLSDLSKTGGIVNAYEALKMAQKMSK